MIPAAAHPIQVQEILCAVETISRRGRNDMIHSNSSGMFMTASRAMVAAFDVLEMTVGAGSDVRSGLTTRSPMAVSRLGVPWLAVVFC